MTRAKFKKEQIVAVLKEHEAGRRRLACLASMGSPKRRSTIGRAEFGGIGVSEAKRLRALDEENAKLKKLLAEPDDRRGRPFAKCYKKCQGAAKRAAVAHPQAS